MIVKARVGSNTGIKGANINNRSPARFYHLTTENLGDQKKAQRIDFKYLAVYFERNLFQATSFIQLIRWLIDTGVVDQNRRHAEGIQTFLRNTFNVFTDRYIGRCELQAPVTITSL